MRSMGKWIDTVKLAPNSLGEIDVLYMEAIGQSDAKWDICYNRSGKIVHREEHVPAKPEEAAADLLKVAKNAACYLSMLLEREPELCKCIAATKSEWPVMADMTEKEWKHPIAETIA